MTRFDMLSEFYKASEIFDDNLFLLTLSLHHFYYKNTIQVSKIKRYVEVQNLDKIKDGIRELLSMNIDVIYDFQELFEAIEYPKDIISLSDEEQKEIYMAYRLEYEKIKG